MSETLTDTYPVPLRRLGVRDLFGESGSPEDLYVRHGLDPRGIKESVEALSGSVPPRR